MTTITAEELYRRYHDRVLRFFQSRLDNREDAEDLTSEVFLKATRALSGFDEKKASASTWIYTISRNTLTDHLRRKGAPEELLEEPDESGTIEEKLLREEALWELAEALARLDKDQSDIIILHYYKELPLTEIACLMRLSYGAVKLRHEKALKALNLLLSWEKTSC